MASAADHSAGVNRLRPISRGKLPKVQPQNVTTISSILKGTPIGRLGSQNANARSSNSLPDRSVWQLASVQARADSPRSVEDLVNASPTNLGCDEGAKTERAGGERTKFE